MSINYNRNNASSFGAQMTPPAMTNGNALACLNADAKEFRPSTDLLVKLQVRTKEVSEYRSHLRNHLLGLCANENQYPIRVNQLAVLLAPVATDRSVLGALVEELISLCEEDETRSTIAARMMSSLLCKLNTKMNHLESYLHEAILARASYWSGSNGSSVLEQQPDQALAFSHLLAALYSTLVPRAHKLGVALASLLDALLTSNVGRTEAGTLFVDGALGLTEINMVSMMEDWVNAGENPEASLERLVSTMRCFLINGKAGSLSGPSSALNALEIRSTELARLRLCNQIDMSRQASDIEDEVYDEYEKFLMETGQQ